MGDWTVDVETVSRPVPTLPSSDHPIIQALPREFPPFSSPIQVYSPVGVFRAVPPTPLVLKCSCHPRKKPLLTGGWAAVAHRKVGL